MAIQVLDIDLSGYSVEKLREMRTDALRMEETFSHIATEARLQAQMYVLSIDNLMDQAVKTEADAKEHIAKGDIKSAGDLRRTVAERKAMIERLSRLVEEKAHIAMEFEKEVAGKQSLATIITARIKQLHTAAE